MLARHKALPTHISLRTVHAANSNAPRTREEMLMDRWFAAETAMREANARDADLDSVPEHLF